MVDSVTVKNLSFAYPASKKRKIFDQISFGVHRNEFFTIIGANGSGKSTLIKLLLGLLSPQQGEIKILGQSQQSMLRNLSYVPQQILYEQQFPILVEDLVISGRLTKYKFFINKKQPKIQEDLEKALSSVNLSGYRRLPFTKLSGGERQRVLIARSLFVDAKILLMDEPTASIDPDAAEGIIQICKNLKIGRTIIFITHDLTLIPDVSDRVMCINNGLVHTHDDVQSLTVSDLLLILGKKGHARA